MPRENESGLEKLERLKEGELPASEHGVADEHNIMVLVSDLLLEEMRRLGLDPQDPEGDHVPDGFARHFASLSQVVVEGEDELAIELVTNGGHKFLVKVVEAPE